MILSGANPKEKLPIKDKAKKNNNLRVLAIPINKKKKILIQCLLKYILS